MENPTVKEQLFSPGKIIWSNGQFLPWEKALTHPIGQGSNYGLGVFEGIRFYETSRGPAIFRLKEHLNRLFFSAGSLHMEIPFTGEELTEAIKELVRRNGMKSGYIRPYFFFGGGKIGLKTQGAVVESVIQANSWNNPPSDLLKVKTSSFRRIDPRSTNVNAKIAGHYVNSSLALAEATQSGFDDAILLDFRGYVAEASVQNIFAVKNGGLYTPRLGTILPGITRDTVMTLARNRGVKVRERNLRMKFYKEADEVFLCGTATEILAVGEIDKTLIGNGRQGEITRQFAKLYRQLITGQNEQYLDWLAFVN